MDLVSRLKRYIDYKGLQNSQIADMAGIPRPTLSQLLTGRNKKVSNELIEKLHSAFPKLNVMWLLFGDGDMEHCAQNKTSAHETGANSMDSNSQTTENVDLCDRYIANNNNAAENPKKIDQNGNMALFQSDASERRVQSIMVFYSDNSFEVFEPVKKSYDE